VDGDGDGDNDLLITGTSNNFSMSISKLYINGNVVSTDNLKFDFTLNFATYPNPTDGNNIQVSYTSTENGSIILNVYNINGQLLRQQKEFATIGEQTFLLDIASLAKGSYFIELEDGERKGIAKFMIQ